MCLRHYFKDYTSKIEDLAFQLSGKVTCNQSLQTPPINGDLLSLTFSSSENGIERKSKVERQCQVKELLQGVKVDGCIQMRLSLNFVLSFILISL